MLLFVGIKRSRRQYFAAWIASCAGHTSTSRCGKNSMSSLWMRPGHRASGPDPGNEILASSSGNQCRSSAQLSSAQRSAALGKARPWPSFFSVCICFTEALGLAIGVGLVYIAYRRTYAFQLQAPWFASPPPFLPPLL